MLDAGESDLGSLGFLHGQLAISLGITCVVVFIFIAASTQSLGKVTFRNIKTRGVMILALNPNQESDMQDFGNYEFGFGSSKKWILICSRIFRLFAMRLSQ